MSWRLWALVTALLLGRVGAASSDGRCAECRHLVDTFAQGMERTKRSHFSGGDTAWEEENLGKYSRSETRLVEIMEHVCKKNEALKKMSVKELDKDGEHRCHALVEEHEETVENWYFHKQASNPDMFRWLCIEALRLCCPAGAFGPLCSACPGDSQRPCFGRGRCDGDGTRAGSGNCRCDKGYQGKTCRLCAASYFAAEQNDTHVTCRACATACKGGCSGDGAENCRGCRSGWLFEEGSGCVDVDECESGPCGGASERCANTAGSYACECVDGYRREGGACVVDIIASEATGGGALSAEQMLRYAAYSGLALALGLVVERRSFGLSLLFVATLFVVVFIELGPGGSLLSAYVKNASDAPSNPFPKPPKPRDL